MRTFARRVALENCRVGVLRSRFKEWVSLSSLAAKYGVSYRKVYDAAQDLKIPAMRGAAKVSPANAERIGRRVRPDLIRSDRQVKIIGPQQFRKSRQGHDGSSYLKSTKKSALVDGQVVAVVQTFVCTCCGVTSTTAEGVCRHCEDHEAMPELQRLRLDLAHFGSLATKTGRQLDDARDEASAGYRSRNSWRSLAVQLVLKHEDVEGVCARCAMPFPCPTYDDYTRFASGRLRNEVEKMGTARDEEELLDWLKVDGDLIGRRGDGEATENAG